jgi:serine/threonine-protein kinase
VPNILQLDAFEREGEMLAQLEHPRIPRFVARFQEGTGVRTRLYLAQEFVAGETLAQRTGRALLTEAEALAIADQVLAVLEYLQAGARPIFHRDIKPANIIQRADGSIAVVDFGTAREALRGLTHRHTLVGTFGYMPPEQLGGTVDRTSDLYGLGATLIHLLSGVAPDDLVTRDLELALPASVIVSDAFRDFVSRLVAREPQHRFADAREARAKLKELIALAAPKEPEPTPPAERRAPEPAAQPLFQSTTEDDRSEVLASPKLTAALLSGIALTALIAAVSFLAPVSSHPQTWSAPSPTQAAKPEVVQPRPGIPEAPMSRAKPVMWTTAMTPPQKLSGRTPRYTREALEYHVEGTMTARCVITVEGTLEQCQIVRSLPHMKDEVLSALATWKMKPATQWGEPLPVRYTIPIRLKLPVSAPPSKTP